MNRRKIGNFISELRKENNMTQDELASKLFVTRTTISKWENGKYFPSLEMMIKLSEIFKVSSNEIYAGEKYTKNNKRNLDNIIIKVLDNSLKK